MKRRIGILTSGGDCPGLNAAIRGVARAAYELFDAEIIGIRNGYGGLIEGEYQEMSKKQFSGILTLGGTILGTSRQPFRNMRVIDERGVDKVAAMKKTYKDLKLDCLVTPVSYTHLDAVVHDLRDFDPYGVVVPGEEQLERIAHGNLQRLGQLFGDGGSSGQNVHQRFILAHTQHRLPRLHHGQERGTALGG